MLNHILHLGRNIFRTYSQIFTVIRSIFVNMTGGGGGEIFQVTEFGMFGKWDYRLITLIFHFS